MRCDCVSLTSLDLFARISSVIQGWIRIRHDLWSSRAHSVSRTSTPLRGRRTFRSVLTIAGSKRFELGLYFALCATLRSRPVPHSGTANHHAPSLPNLSKSNRCPTCLHEWLMYVSRWKTTIILSIRHHFGAQTQAYHTARTEFHKFPHIFDAIMDIKTKNFKCSSSFLTELLRSLRSAFWMLECY